MSQEELEIEIDAQGKVTVVTKGIKGSACLDVTEAITRILGREEERQLTSEYYEQPLTGRSEVQQQITR